MSNSHMTSHSFRRLGIVLSFASVIECTATNSGSARLGSTSLADTAGAPADCSEGQAGLRLPAGFCATIFADSIGSARHLVVAPSGDVFVNLRAARRGPVASIPAGQIGLRDTTGDGHADVTERFGSGGGTGIGLHNGFLYADVGTSIVRYPLPTGQLRPTGPQEVVVSSLPGQPGHDSRNFAIAPDGTMYVNVGSPSNACQLRDRVAGSPGKEDCPELMTRAGIWKFDANALGQTPSIDSRYATGIRNSVAMTLDRSGKRLYAVPHGRDQLSQNWPSLFTPEQNAELPAEMLIRVERGDDFGWPYCYYDGNSRRYVLAPEFGGNGTTPGRCARLKTPLYPFPAHWAPNGVLFHSGAAFPTKYRDGIFVAFHGSWNRAPLPQAGFKVVFLPFRADRALSDFETFADGFTAENPPPNGAAHRPVGLAEGPDGALYVSDDVGGRIWRITWSGARR
jgi:glucose/arabinose dehydrogenase